MEVSILMKEHAMNRHVIWLLTLLPVLAAIGCGGSDEAAQPAEGGDQSQQAVGQMPPGQPMRTFNSATPREAAQSFFAALRDGDEELVELLLTKTARAESEKNGLAINPPGNDTALFTVGAVEYIQEDGAHVAGSWTETTNAGTQTIEIVWILRKESGGWRIAGLAARAQDQNVVYNFEDPLEMQQRRTEAEQRERAAQQVPPAVPEVHQTGAPLDTTPLR
jgi:hypothetical protein